MKGVVPVVRLQRSPLIVIVFLLLAGCASPNAESAPGVASPAGATLDPITPPMAGLLDVDDEPVLGQLGTYIWRDGGSDSPWLPGTPVTVSARPALEFGLSAPVAVDDWQARYTPAGERDPGRFESLGEGRDAIRIAAPPPGRWTMELTVTFGDGLGEAVYYWLIEVQ